VGNRRTSIRIWVPRTGPATETSRIQSKGYHRKNLFFEIFLLTLKFMDKTAVNISNQYYISVFPLQTRNRRAHKISNVVFRCINSLLSRYLLQRTV
jgi:hypothetical protein